MIETLIATGRVRLRNNCSAIEGKVVSAPAKSIWVLADAASDTKIRRRPRSASSRGCFRVAWPVFGMTNGAWLRALAFDQPSGGRFKLT